MEEIYIPEAPRIQSANQAIDLTGMLDPRTKEYQDAVRLTPATLAYYRTGGKWIPARHLLYVSSIIAHEVSQGDARIIVQMPPRHGKSELDSIHTPIWFLDRWPHLNVILATYAAELSTDFGRRVRDAFIEDAGKFLRAHIREDVQRTSLFATEEGGGMMSAGVGGPMTGRGADLLIIDDYIKNFIEAASETTAEANWNWFRSVAYTRLEPGGSIIILATRWPSPGGDLIGRVIDKEGKYWTIIRLPAIAELNDPLGRQQGEALWPERYPIHRLHRIESLLDSWLFGSLYQQDPKESAGISVDVEQIRIVDQIEKPQEMRWVRAWDIASTERRKRKNSDFTSGTLMGTKGVPGSPFIQSYIGDIVHEQWGPNKLEEGIRATAESDGIEVQIIIEQEPGAAGKAYAQHLATNVLAGFNVVIQPASGSKTVRAQPYLAAVNHGRISMLRASWNTVHKEELKQFPNARHDDTVDSTDSAYNNLFQTAVLTPTWGRGINNKALIQQPFNHKLVTGAVFGRRRN